MAFVEAHCTKPTPEACAVRHGTQHAMYAHAAGAEGLNCKAVHDQADYCMNMHADRKIIYHGEKSQQALHSRSL